MKTPSGPPHCFLPLLFAALITGSVFAAPYGPEGRTVDWSQPTGEKLRLRVFGDNYYARTETADGYTVVYSDKSGAYHYAIPAENGKGLTISEVKAHLPPLVGLAKHLESAADEIQAIYEANWAASGEGERAKRWSRRTEAARVLRSAKSEGRFLNAVDAAAANINAAPVVGNLVGLTILVQFPDDSDTNSNDPVSFPATRSKIENFCNEKGYDENENSGSVRDYFFDQSLGKLTYTQDVPQIVTLPKPRNYYNYSNYPINTKLWNAGAAGRLLIEDALKELQNQNFNFSKLTTDSQGNVIATNLMWAGKDSGVWAKGLWPHQSRLSSPGINVGSGGSPIRILNYQATNVEDNAPTIGTFCHENGHLICDYPDLYDIRGEGVGEHCLMGSGNNLDNGRTPSPINAYFKDLVGWENVTDLTADEFVTHSLPSTGNMAFRILKSNETTEFFIVENRGTDDKWARDSVDHGIAIWHVDETIAGNIQVRPHYMVSLEQADGRSDLENGRNRGDSRDLFDLTDPLFANSTSPNSDWWGSSNSSVRIEVLDPIGSNMRVRFGVIPDDTILVDSPNGGELMFRGTAVQIAWDSSIKGNVEIELYDGKSLDSVIAKNISNTGIYNWTVPKDQRPGKNYTIRISSLTNPIPAVDESDDPFTISDSTFPPGESLPYGWYQPERANLSFEVNSSESYEGETSLASPDLGDGKKAGIAYTSNFLAGTLTFRLKCSTEAEFDFATFYIDGKRQILAAREEGLAGEVDWTTFSFPVERGTHTFEWFYEKDDSFGDGRDTVWLDGVILPPTTQEISVKFPAHVDLTSGAAIIDFPDVSVGSESPYNTIMIRNTGRADLQDLKVVINGPNLQSFRLVEPESTVLQPDKSTTFQVVFAPEQKGFQEATIRIFSNDGDEDPFFITLRGTGVPKESKRNTTSAMASPQAVLGTTSEDSGDLGKPLLASDLIDGRTYLTLTVAKSALPDGLDPVVEVSSNLVDWFSGRKHTTDVIDTPDLLKVRDNTPITPGHKRYIRLAKKAPCPP